MSVKLYDVLCEKCLDEKDSIRNYSVRALIVAADGQYRRRNYASARGTYQQAISILGSRACYRCKKAIRERIADCE